MHGIYLRDDFSVVSGDRSFDRQTDVIFVDVTTHNEWEFAIRGEYVTYNVP